jgi:hypothetical protein
MDSVPPGDVTGCSLSVIVPHHGHLAKQHSTTVFNGGPYFFLSVLKACSSRADYLICW